MSKEPLYPHTPRRKEPLFPHVPKAKAITLEVPKELETLAQEARKYKSAEEWRKFDRGKEISKALIGGRGLLPSGTDINYLEKLEALRKWGGDKSDIEIVSAFYNQVTKGEVTEVTPEREVMGASPEAEIDQIIADLNLLREERVWIDTFKIKGASVIHVQSGETATIIEPPQDFTSDKYEDRAMQIKWADGSEMVVDSNDFAPSSLQKQIAEITHGKPIPKFPTAEAAKEPWQMTRAEFAEKYERASWHPEYNEARRKISAIVDKTGKTTIELGREGNKEYLEAKAEMDAQLDIRNTPHVEHVRRALAEGKPVPPKVLADYPEIRRHPQAAPQTTPKTRAKDRRIAYYIQFWSPKSDPENAQPFYWDGPEEGGTFKSLDDALRAASLLEDKRPDAFDIDIHSYEERWEPYEEYPQHGRWQIIEGTMKLYDRRGAVVYDEKSPGASNSPPIRP